VADLLLAVAGGEQGGLVDEVGEVRAGEAGRLAGERVEVDVALQRLAARVDLEDLAPAAAVRAVDGDLAVEAAGAQQGGIEAPRWRPTASISSMKMMQGEFCLACSNRSRTREAPTPTNISTKSDPEMEKNGTPASPATARASSVLPVPGGP
jgi:hypothetical protein